MTSRFAKVARRATIFSARAIFKAMQYFYCAHCGTSLTPLLEERDRPLIGGWSRLRVEESVVQAGYFALDEESDVFVHLDQELRIDPGKDYNSRFGCCGIYPNGTLFLECHLCDTAVAEESSECITPHFIRFSGKRVKAGTEANALEALIHRIELGKMISSHALISVWNLIKYGQPESALVELYNLVMLGGLMDNELLLRFSEAEKEIKRA